MPILLELYSGTGSMGRAFEARGWEVISVDIDPATECTLCMDVRDLTPRQLPVHPDLVWASPVCCHYSRARTNAKTPRDLEWADSLVEAVIDLAAELRVPALFENPESGMLKTRPIVADVPYVVVDYCTYHDSRATHCARKRTAIWQLGGAAWRPSRSLCRKDCGFCTGGKHDESAQQGPARAGQRRHSLNELYAMPPLLCEEIAGWASMNIFGI
jgi:hypothetical protein